jgi:hypothetical protein
MRIRLTGYIVGLLLASVGAAQEVPFEPTTLCDLLKSRGGLSGRMVSVRVEVVSIRESLGADPEDHRCGSVVLADPLSPDVDPKAPFQWIKDSGYEQLEDGFRVLVPIPPATRGRLIATFEGRFDSIYAKGRRQRGGFGHSFRHASQLVVHRVFDVSASAGQRPRE